MSEIPTPETDAFMLERRLTVAREALMAIADKSVNLEHAERMAHRALKLTARNPKP